jgi:hypothetical protein
VVVDRENLTDGRFHRIEMIGVLVGRVSLDVNGRDPDILAGVDLHWYDLRHHEAACRWLAKGLDLRAIQLLLGHADLKTTQRYLNVTDDELRKAMAEKLWSKSAR